MFARGLLALLAVCAAVPAGLQGQVPPPVAPEQLVEPPSAAFQALLQPEPAESILSASGAGMFGSVTAAAVRPFYNEPRWFDSGFNHYVLPWTGVVQVELGYRRENGASWLVNFEFEPIFLTNDSNQRVGFPLIYLDFDRLSSNRSRDPTFDVRWLVGLRAYGFGIGPHAGLVFSTVPNTSNMLSLTSKIDVGYLLPFTLHFRAEFGVAARPFQDRGLT